MKYQVVILAERGYYGKGVTLNEAVANLPKIYGAVRYTQVQRVVDGNANTIWDNEGDISALEHYMSVHNSINAQYDK